MDNVLDCSGDFWPDVEDTWVLFVHNEKIVGKKIGDKCFRFEMKKLPLPGTVTGSIYKEGQGPEINRLFQTFVYQSDGTFLPHDWRGVRDHLPRPENRAITMSLDGKTIELGFESNLESAGITISYETEDR